MHPYKLVVSLRLPYNSHPLRHFYVVNKDGREISILKYATNFSRYSPIFLIMLFQLYGKYNIHKDRNHNRRQGKVLKRHD